MSEIDHKALSAWFMGDDTGSSSKSLAREYAGEGPEATWGIGYPSDPADLGRCLRLIERIPGVRAAVDTLAVKSRYWKVLAPEWDRLAALYASETDAGRPKTYAAMRKLLDAAVDADPRAVRLGNGITMSFGR